MRTLLELLFDAKKAGLVFICNSDGTLSVSGTSNADSLMAELVIRKIDVLRVFDFYSGRDAVLDWADWVEQAEQGAVCGICGTPTALNDPYDHLPRHKKCFEQILFPLRNKPEARSWWELRQHGLPEKQCRICGKNTASGDWAPCAECDTQWAHRYGGKRCGRLCAHCLTTIDKSITIANIAIPETVRYEKNRAA